jgi:hypothetical protein
MVDNLELNQQEINKSRGNGILVPGAYYSNFDRVFPGYYAQTVETDDVSENNGILPFENLASVSITQNIAKNVTKFDIELLGSLENNTKSNNSKYIKYLTFVNTDNDNSTGIKGNLSKEFENSNIDLTGADLIILAETKPQQNKTTGLAINGTAWLANDQGSIRQLSSPISPQFEVQNVYFQPLVDDGTGNGIMPENMSLNSIISITMNNTTGIKLNTPFTIQTVLDSNGKIADKLNDIPTDNEILELKQPLLYPQCYVKDLNAKERKATIKVFDLLPDSKIDVSIGPRTISNSTTDHKGNGVIDLKIPMEISGGLHPITVSVEKTALTSNCVIDIEVDPGVK